jgi:hypothetical protein
LIRCVMVSPGDDDRTPCLAGAVSGYEPLEVIVGGRGVSR